MEAFPPNQNDKPPSAAYREQRLKPLPLAAICVASRKVCYDE